MKLVGRMLDIAEGRSGLCPSKVRLYLERWKAEGYDVDVKCRGLGDVVHSVLEATGVAAAVRAVFGDCRCAKRRDWLNEKVPFNADSEQ